MDTRTLKSLDCYCKLFESLFLDLETHHPATALDLRRDKKTLLRRVRFEGLGFLTCSLPLLSKHLTRGLQTGFWVTPMGYTNRKGTVLPRFLFGLLKQVFAEDGRLLASPDIVCVNDIIQVSQLVYKLDLPSDPKRIKKVLTKFKAVEVDLDSLTLDDEDQVLHEAEQVITRTLKGFDPFEIVPGHGPGAVATGEHHEEKWQFKRKYLSIHRVYPYYDYFVPCRSSLHDSIAKYKDLETLEGGTAKVVLVPKDSRGPRLISMEPLEYQFIQQGLRKALYKHLESVSRETRGYVNFTDQRINRRLAKWNSCTRRYATLDMSEASDRVSLKLVERLFRGCPDVLRCLKATRTSSTLLPDGETLEMKKFAPMGSALCFPVEALVFFALAKAVAKLRGIRSRVYVYGDDILVDVDLAKHLFIEFPRYKLRFNEDKSFVEGYFRESCGMDCYKGEQVTPVRMKKVLPKSRKDGELITAALDFCNRLWCKGFWNTSNTVLELIKPSHRVTSLQPVNFTLNNVVKSYTAKCLLADKWKWVKDYQTHVPLLPLLVTRTRRTKLEGWPRLFESFSTAHVDRYVVPHATQLLKMRWCGDSPNTARV